MWVKNYNLNFKETNFRSTERHLTHGISFTQCYLPPDDRIVRFTWPERMEG